MKNFIPLQDSVIFELRFGFLMKNSIYGQMEMPGDPHLSQKYVYIYIYIWSAGNVWRPKSESNNKEKAKSAIRKITKKHILEFRYF